MYASAAVVAAADDVHQDLIKPLRTAVRRLYPAVCVYCYWQAFMNAVWLCFLCDFCLTQVVTAAGGRRAARWPWT
jgi:hypothetical protein